MNRNTSRRFDDERNTPNSLPEGRTWGNAVEEPPAELKSEAPAEGEANALDIFMEGIEAKAAEPNEDVSKKARADWPLVFRKKTTGRQAVVGSEFVYLVESEVLDFFCSTMLSCLNRYQGSDKWHSSPHWSEWACCFLMLFCYFLMFVFMFLWYQHRLVL